MRTDRVPAALLGVMVSTVAAYALTRTAADPDLWGHVRFGQDIINEWAIPRTDPYSFTSDEPWVNHEWLAEASMAVAFSKGGSLGLVLLKLLLGSATLVVLWRAVRKAGVHTPLAAVLLLTGMIGVSPLLIAVRPQLYSVLIFAIQLALINGIRRGNYRLFLWMPLLFAVWSNLHGGWIVGAGTLALWACCSAFFGIVPWRWAVGAMPLALLGSLATPYGIDLWRFLWETVGIGRADVGDWQPLFRTPAKFVPWVLTLVVVGVSAYKQGRAATVPLIVAGVLGVLAFQVVRLGGFFALASVILLAPGFAGIGPREFHLSRVPTRHEMLVVGGMCLAALICTAIPVRRNLACITIVNPTLAAPWAPEAEAIAFLQTNSLSGRLLTYFDYGETAIWHLWPKLKVSYDGRRETVYSEVVRDAHGRFYTGTRDTDYPDQIGADFIWIPRRLPILDSLRGAGWIPIYDGPKSVVLSRVPGTYVQPKPWNGPRCFPGP